MGKITSNEFKVINNRARWSVTLMILKDATSSWTGSRWPKRPKKFAKSIEQTSWVTWSMILRLTSILSSLSLPSSVPASPSSCLTTSAKGRKYDLKSCWNQLQVLSPVGYHYWRIIYAEIRWKFSCQLRIRKTYFVIKSQWQCDQIWRFIGFWATFQSLWQ